MTRQQPKNEGRREGEGEKTFEGRNEQIVNGQSGEEREREEERPFLVVWKKNVSFLVLLPPKQNEARNASASSFVVSSLCPSFSLSMSVCHLSHVFFSRPVFCPKDPDTQFPLFSSK